MAKSKKPEKGSWIVRLKCEVTKEVVCDDCTEEEAESDPFEHAVEETEIDQIDYQVVDVKPNT